MKPVLRLKRKLNIKNYYPEMVLLATALFELSAA